MSELHGPPFVPQPAAPVYRELADAKREIANLAKENDELRDWKKASIMQGYAHGAKRIAELGFELTAAKDREKRLDAALAETLGKVVDLEQENGRLRQRVEELETEVHEWEESDAADLVLRPILAEEKESEVRADERKKTAERCIAIAESNKPEDETGACFEGEVATCDNIISEIRHEFLQD